MEGFACWYAEYLRHGCVYVDVRMCEGEFVLRYGIFDDVIGGFSACLDAKALAIPISIFLLCMNCSWNLELYGTRAIFGLSEEIGFHFYFEYSNLLISPQYKACSKLIRGNSILHSTKLPQWRATTLRHTVPYTTRDSRNKQSFTHRRPRCKNMYMFHREG